MKPEAYAAYDKAVADAANETRQHAFETRI